MYCTCTVHVLYMYSACTVHVLYMYVYITNQYYNGVLNKFVRTTSNDNDK